MGRALVYRRRHRLTTDAQYRAVFGYKARKGRGPLTVFARPNGLPEHRLGLSVGRRVGRATERTRVKRLIREAFRHERPGLPLDADGHGYDLVVSARAHEPMPLEQWRSQFREAAQAAIRVAQRRASRDGGDPGV